MGDNLGDFPREDLEKFCKYTASALGYLLTNNTGIMVESEGDKVVVYSHEGQILIAKGDDIEGFEAGRPVDMLEG